MIRRDPLVLAHRGASAYAPENTLVAFDLGLELGADYIELDVRMSADGSLVVMHDATLERTARGIAGSACHEAVSALPLADLMMHEAGTWFNDAFPPFAREEHSRERIPTLQEVLDRYANDVFFCIELKDPALYPGVEEELVRLVRRFGLVRNGMSRAIVQSSSPAALLTVQELEPSIPLLQLFHHARSCTTFEQLDWVACYARGIGPPSAYIDRPLLDAAHARGLDVYAYTVNRRDEMIRLIDLGVDGLFTDAPDVVTALYGESPGLGLEAISAPYEARRPA